MKKFNDLFLFLFLATLLVLHTLPANALAGYADAFSAIMTIQKSKKIVSCGRNVDKSVVENRVLGDESAGTNAIPPNQGTGCHISSFYLMELSVPRLKTKCTLC